MKLFSLLASALFATSAHATIQSTTSSANDETTITASNTDIGQTATITRTAGSVFAGINGGNAAQLIDGNASSGNGLFHSSGTNGTHFPATYTIDLDISTNTEGYNITGIDTIAGWNENGRTLANQKYEVLYSVVGSSDYISLGTHTYTPFTTSTGASGSRISLTDTNGLIASGVDSIRFIIQNHGIHTGPAQGTVYKEFDIIGAPTAGVINGIQPGSKDIGPIWFIGDSITQSNADGDANGSPRKALFDILTNNNYTFTFTGHSTANTDGLSGADFTSHSGISGSTIGANSNGRVNMTNGIPTWWNQGRLNTEKPRAVLIMLGTNDIDLNDAVATAPNRLKTIVDTILAQVGAGQPTPSIFVAQIPPNLKNAAATQRVIDFNNALPAIVASLVSEGKDVTLVDHYTRLNADTASLLRADNLHTNTAGNRVIAQQWFDAIQTKVGGPVTLGSESSTTATDLIDEISNTDLAQNATITGPAGTFGNGASLQTGSATAGTQPALYLDNEKLPATYTINLDTSTFSEGYEITQLTTFAGWTINGPALANQRYTLEIATADAPTTFTEVGTYAYIPFGSEQSGGGASKMILKNADDSPLGTGIAALRITFLDHGFSGPNTAVAGTVYYEFDIAGTAVPVPLSISSPTERTIIQRNSQNTANIPIAGVFEGTPDRIEARAVAATPTKNLGNIWFIGDSITQSNADGDGNGSPRKSLYDLLTADGYTFTYTGNRTNNVDGLPATGGTADTNLYHYHSGISGSMIGANTSGRTNMTAGVPGWWNGTRLANNKPNIVLIMLGTNDIDQNDSIATAPDRIKLLVDTILNQVGPNDPTPSIFVAQIPPNRGSTTKNDNVLAFNAALPAIVNTLVSEGKDVTLVDNYTPIDADKDGLMRDTLHTNTAGNGVLATQWFNAIENKFDFPTSGATTNWQTIENAPTGNTFSGTLENVQAGGWYELQVRTIVSGTENLLTAREKIGVGDIFIIAGQSNSANHGSPAQTTTNDRVSVRSSLTNNLWQTATDPLPIATGTGGSTWTRLGDQYVASQNIPIGFISVGVGGTATSRWLPAANDLYPRLRSAVQSFPSNGFKAILWHQGESDAFANLSAAVHRANLETIIAESRTDSGWDTPWYLAEASFVPTIGLNKELPINAGQRNTTYADPLTSIGPRTDDFHLENKLHDGIHFNAAGLLDHATQWHAILTGNPPINILNADFESNTALADGGIAVTTITANNSPSVIAYQILAANGTDAADGSNGYYNPDATYYTNAADTLNAGVAPNMSGPHAAFLNSGTAGNHFLQSLRTNLEPNTTYTLTIAIGRRAITNTGTFSDVKIEILANGQPVGTPLTISENDLTADTFTDASVSYTAPDSQAPNQPLSIRITKLDGAGTYTDFDNIRLTNELTAFGIWQQNNFNNPNSELAKKNADPDIDAIPNIIEYFLGTSPTAYNTLPNPTVSTTDGTITIPLDPSVTDPGLELKYSLDLVNWHKVTTPAHAGVTNTRTPSAWTAEIPLTTTPNAFFHLTVE